MKIALYIAEGYEQIVLTPETATETSILAKLDDARSVEIKRGQFYACQGGWVRHSSGDNSTIIVLEAAPDARANPGAMG